MKTIKNDTSFFDDDFEVTLEEDPSTSINSEIENVAKPLSDVPVTDDSLYTESLTDDTSYDKPLIDDPMYEGSLTDDTMNEDILNDKSKARDASDPRASTEHVKETHLHKQRPRTKKIERTGKKVKAKKKSLVPKNPFAHKKSRMKMPHIPAPVKDTAKHGIKAVYHTVRFILRTISLLLIAGITGLLAYKFWQGAIPHGSLYKILSDRNYTLAAYIAVAAVFLMFEVISFFWAMSGTRVREGLSIYKEDLGRGLFSFIFIYASSYLSFQFSSYLPKSLGSAAVMSGIKEALTIFGALHSLLFILCAAGVISCLIRKGIAYFHF